MFSFVIYLVPSATWISAFSEISANVGSPQSTLYYLSIDIKDANLPGAFADVPGSEAYAS
jgi:hypothetical protein